MEKRNILRNESRNRRMHTRAGVNDTKGRTGIPRSNHLTKGRKREDFRDGRKTDGINSRDKSGDRLNIVGKT